LAIERILIYDMVREMGWSIRRAAPYVEQGLAYVLRQWGLPREKVRRLAKRAPRTLLRRFLDAVKLIKEDGREARLSSAKEFIDHCFRCRRCREAATKNDDRLLCDRMQRRLGLRTSRITGCQRPARKWSSTSIAWFD
jgi:hypothetical protein